MPDLDVPELRRMVPDAAADKMFAVAITIEPEPELTLEPLESTTAPPRSERPKPPDTLTDPPALPVVVEPLERSRPPAANPPLVTAPTIMLIMPPRPPVETPEVSKTNPEFPLTDVPVLRVREPETPLDNTLALAMTTDPEPELILLPLTIATDEPKIFSFVPPSNVTPVKSKLPEPPLVLSPAPATMLMVPPRPPVALPVTIAMNPLLLDLVVPVLIVKLPDKPTDSALADEIVMAPEPLLTLLPL